MDKKIIKAGTRTETPPPNSIVTVHYAGQLLDGTVFDSSFTRKQPFSFQLGRGEVIKGWDVGVATMKKGERAKLTLQPDYAYGAGGAGDVIPANAVLVFEVELLKWEKPSPAHARRRRRSAL